MLELAFLLTKLNIGANMVEYKTILTAPLYPHLQIVPVHLVVVAVRPFP